VLALFSLVSLLAFSGVGALVGWRILRLARATGGAPERWVALCLLSICGVGYPIAIASQLLPPGGVRVLTVALGVAAIDFGLGCNYLFTRSVFRPGVAWLRFAVAGVWLALALHWVGLVHALWGARAEPDALTAAGAPWTILVSAISCAGFAWSGSESLRYFAILRRRLALGLADPLVVNRFLLWGLVGVSTMGINFANAWTALRGVNVLQDPFAMAATGCLGLFNAVAMWLAFLPPEAYVRRVRGASASGGLAK
jgi:hypothetical protein